MLRRLEWAPRLQHLLRRVQNRRMTMKTSHAIAIGTAVAALLVAGAGAKLWSTTAESPSLQEVKAILTAPPLVPPPVDRRGNARVIVNLEATEVTGTLADGVRYSFWTFGGTVPGPMIRVRAGDSV